MMIVLSPEAAARKVEEDPHNTYVRIGEVVRGMGLTEQEIMGELRSGRLKASGVPTEDGFKDVCVSAADLLRWMTETDTAAGRKARDWLHSQRRLLH